MPGEIHSRETEEYGRAEAQREALWQEKYGAKLPELCRRIDEILAGPKEQIVDRLTELLEQKEIKDNYKAAEEIAAVNIALMIRRQELQCGESGSILNGITSVKQIEERLQKVRFAIYRMEFLFRTDKGNGFLQCMQEEQLTVTAAGSFIVMAAVHPLQVALRVEEAFWSRGMYGKEILFLEFIMQKWPGNQRLMKKLVDLYKIAQREAYAAGYEAELTDYTAINGVSGEEAQVLQERLWCLRYGDTEAVRECVKLMEEKQELEQIFAELILRERTWQAKEYLQAANAWLAAGKDMLADKILETGNNATAGEVRKKLQELDAGGKESYER